MAVNTNPSTNPENSFGPWEFPRSVVSHLENSEARNHTPGKYIVPDLGGKMKRCDKKSGGDTTQRTHRRLEAEVGEMLLESLGEFHLLVLLRVRVEGAHRLGVDLVRLQQRGKQTQAFNIQSSFVSIFGFPNFR